MDKSRFNEEKNIPLILDRFAAVIKRSDVETILVDNGSTDQSATILKKLIQKYPFARTVHVTKNHGYGFGILSGLKEAQGKFNGWTHADMQTDPGDVIHALEILESLGFPEDMYLKGKRRGRRLLNVIFTTGMALFETVYLHSRLWDINAQPNLFSRAFFKKLKNPPHDFSLDLYVYYMARKLKCKIRRFPVQFPERIHGQSHWDTGLKAKFKFIKRTLSYSKTLKKELQHGVHRSPDKPS